MKSAIRAILMVSGISLACALTVPAFAADHSSHGDSKKEDAKGGGKMAGHDHQPGDEMEMCHAKGDMPPHYCEPVYDTMSSVRGIKIGKVDPGGDRAVMVELVELNGMHPGVKQKLVVVGGAGDLAGAVVVDGGWKDKKTVHLEFSGSDTIYEHKKIHLHVFPVTAN